MAKIANLLYRIHQYLTYRKKSVGAHAIHSPFVYKLYQEIIRPTKRQRDHRIEGLRQSLKRKNTPIEVTEYKTGVSSITTIGSIAKRSASSARFSSFLRELITYVDSKTVLETGTSLGINTLYLASSSADKVVSIDASKLLCSLSEKNLEEFKDRKVQVVNGDIHDILEKEIVHYQPDFYFLDADHRSTTVAFCIDLILKHTPNAKCIVVHDINWSEDMNEIWGELTNDPRFTLTIDIFEAGILFPNLEMPKQHFVLRF